MYYHLATEIPHDAVQKASFYQDDCFNKDNVNQNLAAKKTYSSPPKII